jgi:hypothetical protein
MYVNVDVHVDADTVLTEMTIEEIEEHLAARSKDRTESPHLMLERVYEEFRRRGDAPKILIDYIWAVLGRVL